MPVRRPVARICSFANRSLCGIHATYCVYNYITILPVDGPEARSAYQERRRVPEGLDPCFHTGRPFRRVTTRRTHTRDLALQGALSHRVSPMSRHSPCPATALLRLKENRPLRSANAMYRLHTVLFSTEDKACVAMPLGAAERPATRLGKGGGAAASPRCIPLPDRGLSRPRAPLDPSSPPAQSSCTSRPVAGRNRRKQGPSPWTRRQGVSPPRHPLATVRPPSPRLRRQAGRMPLSAPAVAPRRRCALARRVAVAGAVAP